MEQKEKLESEKDKSNVTKNAFEQMDNDYKKDINNIHLNYTQNNKNVVDFLIGSILNVEMSVPESLKKGDHNL